MGNHAHMNHVRFFLDEDVDASSAGTNTVLYTPPTGKVLDVKHIIISPEPNAIGFVDIYNDTSSGTNDQVFRFDFDSTDGQSVSAPIHLKDLSGFTFSKGFQCVTSAAGNCSVAVSGILI